MNNNDEQSRPTRKELIGIRRKLYNLPAPPRRRRQRSEEPQRKKPGRKPETLQARGLKTHDFGCARLPSDAESDYEGYLSESEDIFEKVPKLTRSQSSDSIFLDMNYKDYRFNRVSDFHNYPIHRPKHPIAKLRRRKMNRITQKHTLRYRLLEKEYSAHKEMLECYHGNLPRLADEIARTKNCIRNPHKHKKLNVPKVFTYGDAKLVDVCASVLKDTVALTVAFEHASTRAGNSITRELQEARVKRRNKLETLPKALNQNKRRVPSCNILAMEFFFLRQVKSDNEMTLGIKFLQQFTERCSNFVLLQPKYLLMYNMRMQFVEREKYEFEEFLKTQRKLRRHLDRTLKEVLIDTRSYQAEAQRDHERRLARREHAEKVAARKKLSPEERARLEEEDERNKEDLKKEKDCLKKILKKTKEMKARLIKSRLHREAKDMMEYNAKEELLRSRHHGKIRKMQKEARLEKRYLHNEHRRLEELRREKLNRRERERREAARLVERRRKEREERKIQEERERRKEREAEKKRLEAAERERLEAERVKSIKEAEKALLKAMLEKQRRKELEKQQKKEIEAERLRLQKVREEELKKELDEKIAKERHERLEEIRRQNIYQATNGVRAKIIVAKFTKHARLYLERKRKIAPENPENECIVVDGNSFWSKYGSRLMKSREPRSQVRVAEPKNRRAKSEEAPIRQKHGDIRYFSRWASSMDLTEINKYVAKKWNYARRAISPERKNVRSESDIPPSFDEKEVSSLETIFSGTSHSNDTRRFNMLAAILECGSQERSEDDQEDRGKKFSTIRSYYENYGLLRVSPQPINQTPMAPIPMVAQLHKEFVTSKECWMEEARQSLFIVKDIGNEERYEPFKKLAMCYIEIFRFNLYLFRLYLDTVEFRIFNCYAVYEAERKRDDTFIRKGIKRVEDIVGSVSSAFFNEQPLIRQLEELRQMKEKHSREEMDCYVAALCRYAINRIRAPAIADEKLNLSCWVNSTRSHELTLTVAHLGIESTFPPEFTEKEYLKQIHQRGFEEDVFKRIMNSFYGANIEVAHTVLLALHHQLYNFFEYIRTRMPNRKIDPIMRVYYGQQAFQNVINVLYRKTHCLTERNRELIGDVNTSVLITGIVEQGKQRRNSALRTALDNMFMEMSEYKAVSLPIYPSTIGVSFVCFEQLLLISVVQESRILLDKSFKKKDWNIPDNQEMVTFDVDAERKFHMIVDKRNRELSISFSLKNGPNKVDRLAVNSKLHKRYFTRKIDWEAIFLKYFNGKFGDLDRFLKTQPLATEGSVTSRIGSLERPRERKPDLRSNWFDQCVEPLLNNT